MEENPELDFGAPGPMFDFIESSYEKGCKKLWLESVRHRPMDYTVKTRAAVHFRLAALVLLTAPKANRRKAVEQVCA